MSTIGISAEISMKLDKAKQKQAIAELRDTLKGVSLTPIKLQFDGKDLSAQIIAAAKNIKLDPIKVPITPVWGKVPPFPGGVNVPGGAPAPGGATVPGAGGGGSGGMLYNPLSPRGLARLAGSGAAVYGAIAAMHVAGGLADAADISSHPERFLNSMSRLGDRHNATNDPFMVEQAGNMAGIAGEKKVHETINSIPLLGTLTRFLDQISGVTRGLEDMEKGLEGATAIHKYAKDLSDQADAEAAALTHNPLTVRADQRKKEQAVRAGDIAKAQSELDQAIARDKKDAEAARRAVAQGSQGMAMLGPMPEGEQVQKARQALAELQTAQAASTANDPKKDALVQGDVNAMIAHSEGGVRRSVARSRAEGYEFRGEKENALSITHASELEDIGATYDDRKRNAPDFMKGRIDQEKGAAIEAAKTRQKTELDELHRAENAAKAENDAKIEKLDADSQDRMLAARGATVDLEIEQIQRRTKETVKQIDIEIEKERDKTKKTQLEVLKQKTIATGAIEEQAIQVHNERVADRSLTAARGNNRVAQLRAGGMERAAAELASENEFQGEAADLATKYKGRENDPGYSKDMQAAVTRDQTRRTQIAQSTATQMRSRIIDTLDATARAHGQEHVGDILRMQAEAQDAERNAAGDNKQERLVAAQEKAHIEEFRKSLRPRSRTFGLDQYHDAIQESITNGVRNDAALKLADAWESNIGAAGVKARGGPAAIDPAQSLHEAAQMIGKMCSKILNGPRLGTFHDD